jgi:ABC-2 type transport system permease protein
MDFTVFKALFKKELKEQWRTSRVIISYAVLIFAGLSALLLTKFLPDIIKASAGSANMKNIQVIVGEQSAIDAVASYLGNMLQFPALSIILLAMGAIAHERERGTAVLVLTKPVSRFAFVLSKFTAYWLILASATLVTAALTYYYLVLLFTVVPFDAFLILNLNLLMLLTMVLALTFVCSSLFRTQIAAGGLAFVSFILFTTLVGLFPDVSRNLPNVIASGKARKLLMGAEQVTDFIIPLLSGALISAILVAASCWIVRSKEI